MLLSKMVIKCGNFAVLVDLHVRPLAGQQDASWFTTHHTEEVTKMIRKAVNQRVKQHTESIQRRGQPKQKKELAPGKALCVKGKDFNLVGNFVKRHFNLRCVNNQKYGQLRVFPERCVVCVSRPEDASGLHGNPSLTATELDQQGRSDYFSGQGEPQELLNRSTMTKRDILQKIARRVNSKPKDSGPVLRGQHSEQKHSPEVETPAPGVDRPPLERRDPPLERRDPALERRDPALERRDPALERRDPALERRDPALERRDPALERRDPALERRPGHGEESPGRREGKGSPVEERPEIQEEKASPERTGPGEESAGEESVSPVVEASFPEAVPKTVMAPSLIPPMRPGPKERVTGDLKLTNRPQSENGLPDDVDSTGNTLASSQTTLTRGKRCKTSLPGAAPPPQRAKRPCHTAPSVSSASALTTPALSSPSRSRPRQDDPPPLPPPPAAYSDSKVESKVVPVPQQPETTLEVELLTPGKRAQRLCLTSNNTAQTNQNRLAASLRGLSVKPASSGSSSKSTGGEEGSGNVTSSSRLRRLKRS